MPHSALDGSPRDSTNVNRAKCTLFASFSTAFAAQLQIIQAKPHLILALREILYKNTVCLYKQSPTQMIKLTPRQEQILNLIKDAIDNTGFPPTRAEIANELGF